MSTSIYLHDLTYAPVALWQFNGDLTDSSGNGLTLSVEAGTLWYADLARGVKGIYFDGSTRLTRGVWDSVLAISGDLTIEMIVRFQSLSASDSYLASFGASGETFGVNALYEFILLANRAGIMLLAENGAGSNP